MTNKTASGPSRKVKREIVIAPPGCGKTDKLAEQIADLIIPPPGRSRHNAVNPERILCITFTNQAASEMEERVSSYLEEKNKKKKEKEGAPSLPIITTLHAFCYDCLKEDGNEIIIIDEDRFKEFAAMTDSEDPEKPSLLVFNRTEDNVFRYKEIIPTHLVLKNAFQLQRGKSFTPVKAWEKTSPELNKMLEYYARRYNSYKAQLNEDVSVRYMDFNDLLFEARKAIDNGHWNDREKYETVFVDEVQDMTPFQLMIINKLVSSSGTIRYFGDPEQAIYGFMGAKIGQLFKLLKTCEKKKFYRINYRSPQYLISGLNRFAEEFINLKFEKKLFSKGWQQLCSAKMKRVPRPKYGTAVIYASSFVKEMESILGIIDSFPDMESNAILARDNYSVGRIIGYLKKLNRYTVIDSEGTEHTYFLRLLTAHIEVCLNPEDKMAWIKLLPLVTRSEERMNADSLLRWMEQFGVTPLDIMTGNLPDEKNRDIRINRQRFLQRAGMQVLAHKLKNQYCPLFNKTKNDIEKLLNCDEKFDTLDGINNAILDRMGAWFVAFIDAGFLPPHIKPLWYAAKGRIQIAFKKKEKNLLCGKKLVDQRLRFALKICKTLNDDPEKLLSRASLGKKRIIVMTIHQAKGRGYDNVFIFEAKKGRYSFRTWRQEDNRLYFVGLSRAKKRIILSLSSRVLGNYVEELFETEGEPVDLQPRNWYGGIDTLPTIPFASKNENGADTNGLYSVPRESKNAINSIQ